MSFAPVPGTSQSSTVTASSAVLATALVATGTYMFASTTACWIRQSADATANTATAAAPSMFVPANTIIMIDGQNGAQIAIIRDAADGRASITRAGTVNPR